MKWLRSLWESRKDAAGDLSPKIGPNCKFTPRALEVLLLAKEKAKQLGHSHISTEHVLFGLAKTGNGCGYAVLRKMGLNARELGKELEIQFGNKSQHPSKAEIYFGPATETLFAAATEYTKKLGHTYVGTEHLMLALLDKPDAMFSSLMRSLKVDPAETRAQLLTELDPPTSRAKSK